MKIQIRTDPLLRIGSDLIDMVEMARVEPASENLFPQLSTGVVYHLGFPSENAGKQAFSYGSL